VLVSVAELRAAIESDRDDPTLTILEADAEDRVIARFGPNFPTPVAVTKNLDDLSLTPPALFFLERPAATLLTLTTALGGANRDLTFTSKTPGVVPTIQYAVNGINTPLSVGVVGVAITVNVATNGAGAATTTAAQVAAAILASAAASALVTAANATGNDGTGIVVALAVTPLAVVIPAITSIVEVWGDFFNETTTTLAATDYRVRHGGRVLERIGNSVNPRWTWGHRVTITYIPVDDTTRRKGLIIDLVKLALRFSGATSQTIGNESESVPDYTGERERLLDGLSQSVAFT
jgi:hypothetical protein